MPPHPVLCPMAELTLPTSVLWAGSQDGFKRSISEPEDQHFLSLGVKQRGKAAFCLFSSLADTCSLPWQGRAVPRALFWAHCVQGRCCKGSFLKSTKMQSSVS